MIGVSSLILFLVDHMWLACWSLVVGGPRQLQNESNYLANVKRSC